MTSRLFERLPRGPVAGGVLAFAAAAGVLAPAQAQTPASAPSGIYTCVDDQGRRLTSDRPIAQCTAKEQRILNRDGSLRGIYPPILTVEERAAKEARERKAAIARAAYADAVRRDRNLMARFPDEVAHTRAREAALDTVRLAIRASALRMNSLEAERKPLLEESEFYVGRELPAKLKSELDANDAARAAQEEAMLAQEAELDRINGLYDAELAHLRRLWGGAAPGSLGSIAAAPGPARKPAP